MAKLTLADVSSILGNPTSAANTVNVNNALIEASLEKTLSRDGSTPNQMLADFDVNNNDILNVNNLQTTYLTLNGSVVIPGDYDLTLLNPAYVRGLLGVGHWVSTIADLSASNVTYDKSAVVIDNGRGGLFDWQTGDFTAERALDPEQGWFVKSDALPVTSGMWVRRTYGTMPTAYQFGAKGDGTTDDTTALQALINFAPYFNQRSRALHIPRGRFNFSYIEIPLGTQYVGISFNGDSFWDSNLICTEDSTRPAIWNKSQETKFFDLSIGSIFDNSVNFVTFKHGLRNDKGVGQTADIDVTVSRCRFSAYWSGIYHRGRGLDADNNHFSTCNYGIELDWYDTTDYLPGADVLADTLAFRGISVTSTRFHSMTTAAVANKGPNASKLWGFNMANVVMDIGRILFDGHLGTQSVITNCNSNMSGTEILILRGGTSCIVSNISGGGSVKGGGSTRIPDNIVRFSSGTFVGCQFNNWVLSVCDLDAILATGTTFDGCQFNNITFVDVGYTTPANNSCFNFGAAVSTIEITNPIYIGSDNLQSFVASNAAGNFIRLNSPRIQGGGVFPWFSGTGTLVTDKKQTYTPTLTNQTNVTTSVTVPALLGLNYIYLDDDYLLITGRVNVAAGGAGNSVLRVSLPLSNDITAAEQITGNFTATTAGRNHAGGIVGDPASNTIECRWVATDAVNTSYSLVAFVRLT